MFEIEICIDVPDLARGLQFYADAFGFTRIAVPYPGVAIFQAGEQKLTLLEREKAERSKPSPSTADVRRYARH